MFRFVPMNQVERFIFRLMLSTFLLFAVGQNRSHATVWNRHGIDQSSKGADGVRLADANNDGYLDVVTGWEEGGVIRVYLNPGPAKVKQLWPAVTAGEVDSPEDAVFVDLDEDGMLDVVSCSEGKTNQITAHFAPGNPVNYLDSSQWETRVFDRVKDLAQWMFCLPANLDSTHGIDLIVGAKNENAAIGWLESPENPRDTSAWRWRPIKPVGWIMSILPVDFDHAHRLEILFSDRKGSGRGIYRMTWLNDAKEQSEQPPEFEIHKISESEDEFMFIDAGDFDQDGATDICAAVKPKRIVWYRQDNPDAISWISLDIPLPEQAGTAKAVKIADIDRDGRNDLVFSCENADGAKEGVMWIENRGDFNRPIWVYHSISGADGIKFDLIELIDLDQDGDLDVVTCEESENLGVIWYENPLIP